MSESVIVSVNPEENTVAPFRVQVEIWGRVFGTDNMTMLGTIDYHLEGGELISNTDFRVSLTEFLAEVQEEMNDARES